jgi:hypothetical protein
MSAPSTAAAVAASIADIATTAAVPSQSTQLITGTTINDETGEEEEFTIETIPLAQLSVGDTDRISTLAAKVLKYFDDEAAESAASTATTTDAVSATSTAPTQQ